MKTFKKLISAIKRYEQSFGQGEVSFCHLFNVLIQQRPCLLMAPLPTASCIAHSANFSLEPAMFGIEIAQAKKKDKGNVPLSFFQKKDKRNVPLPFCRINGRLA